MLSFDFHTHNMFAPAGNAIVSLPQELLLNPEDFFPVPGALHSAGLHPWWTEDDVDKMLSGLSALLRHSQVVAVGECGLDKLRGASLSRQCEVFARQVELASEHSLPMTIHCVKAFGELLHLHKTLRPTTRWTVHGFRGGPKLAEQLLDAGMDLSFGLHHNADSLRLTPEHRRHFETDDSGVSLADVLRAAGF